MNKVVKIFFKVSAIVVFICYVKLDLNAQSGNYALINSKATDKTNALYQNLQWYKGKGVMFGHQDDLAYGVNWQFEEGRSDVMEVCSDFPAVFGWDVSGVGVRSENNDQIDFNQMRKWIRMIYKSGGIVTFNWYMDNPATGEKSKDISVGLSEFLPEGKHHDKFKERLDHLAEFINSLHLGNSDNKQIPIILRPFHQSKEESLWWSARNCSPEDYKALWRFMTDYLLNEKSLNTLIFAFSTDQFDSEESFLEYYPGDNYVDVIGLNLYDNGKSDFFNDLSQKLLILNTVGSQKNKVTAISETGYKQVPSSNWWTDQLLKGIFRDRYTANISFIMIGKNRSSEQFYAPYPGHSSAENFRQLYENLYTLFLEDIPDIYVEK